MSQESVDYKSWISARDAMAVSMLAIAGFILEITIGLVLTPIFANIPLIGGTLSAIPDSIIVFFGAFLIPRKGGILLYSTILLMLSTFTASFGPPGLYKIAIGLALGITFEMILAIGGRHRVFPYIFGTCVAFAASIPFTMWAWVLFGLPGVDQLLPKLWFLMAVYFGLALIGSLTAYYFIYKPYLAHVYAIQIFRAGTYQKPEQKADEQGNTFKRTKL